MKNLRVYGLITALLFLFTPSFITAKAKNAAKPAGELQGFTVSNNTAALNYPDMTFQVRILSNGIVHIYGQNGKKPIPHYSYAVVHPNEPAATFVKDTGDSLLLDTGGVIVTITKKDMQFKVAAKGKTVFSGKALGAIIDDFPGFCIDYDYNKERFFGMGGQSPQLEITGKTIRNYNADWYPYYATFPVYLAIGPEYSCGVFYDSAAFSVFSFDDPNPQNGFQSAYKEDTYATSFGAMGETFDLYIYTGTPKEILEKFTSMTGRPYLPPLWAFGFHQCKYSYMDENAVRAVAKNFETYDMPVESIWLDIDYMDEYKTFTVNEDTFPDMKKLTSDLLAMGIKTVTIIDPGVKKETGYWVYESGAKKNVFIRKPGGDYFLGKVWPGMCVYPDYSNPATRNWWAGLYQTLHDWGISGQWIDMNEPSVFVSDVSAFRMDSYAIRDWEGIGAEDWEIHNVYGLTMAMATSMGIYSADPSNRVFLLTRSAYPGIQRYAFMWTGDNKASWDNLAQVVPMVLNLGLSGMPYSGSDIGGFSASPSAELFTRWLQLGVFIPFMRDHTGKGTLFQEPYAKHFEKYRGIIRNYLYLRYRLLPYLYTQVYHATLTGAPIARPLFFDYGYQYCDIDNEFMMGNNMLICPVITEGQTKFDAVLPPGEWVDYWTGKKVPAGKVTLDITITNIPVFIRGGSILPTYEFKMKNTAALAKMRDVTMTVYPDSTGYAFGALYEDDGISWSFMHDGYLLSAVTYRQSGDKASIMIKTVGAYNPGRKLIFIVPAGVKTVSINGGNYPVTDGKVIY